MHYDLSFLDVGRKWLPPKDKERMERYAGNRNLYEGDHDKVFGKWYKTLRQDLAASLEIIVNFPRRLSNLWASLLVGDAPTLKLPDERKDDQEAKDRLLGLVNRGLIEALRECVLDMSRFGDGLLKARLDEEGEVVEAVSPELWFPVVSRSNIRKITHHVLAWTLEEERPDGLWAEVSQRIGFGEGINKYLYAEIHTKGRVEYRLLQLTSGGYIGKEVAEEKRTELFPDWPEGSVETHNSGMLIVHVPNPRSTNRLYGYDDYKDVEGLVMASEVRLAQQDMVNELHGFPVMAGPPIEAPEAGSEEALQVATGERYIAVDVDSTGRAFLPEYIQRDINVESIELFLDRIEKWLYIVSHTSSTAFGVSETGFAESGTSLALRMQNELERSSEIRLFLDPAAKEIIRIATALAGDEIADADIGWRDGLPIDKNEEKDRWSVLVGAGLASKKRAIMALYDLSEEEADAEIEAIEEDAQSALPPELAGPVPNTERLLEKALANGSEASTGANSSPADPSSEL